MTRRSGPSTTNRAMLISAVEFASPFRAANISFTETANAFWRLGPEAQVEDRSVMSLFAASSKVACRIDLAWKMDLISVCHHSVIMKNNTNWQSFYLRRMVLINGLSDQKHEVQLVSRLFLDFLVFNKQFKKDKIKRQVSTMFFYLWKWILSALPAFLESSLNCE